MGFVEYRTRRWSRAGQLWRVWIWPPGWQGRLVSNVLPTVMALGLLRLVDSPLLGDEIGWTQALMIAVPLYLVVAFIFALSVAPSRMDAEATETHRVARRNWWQKEKTLTEELDRLRRLRAPSVTLGVSIGIGPVARIGITNDGPVDDFQVQVVSWANGYTTPDLASRGFAVTLPWVNGSDRFHRIAPGATEFVEIVSLEHEDADPRVTNDDGQIGSGLVTVVAPFMTFGCLGAYTYWEVDDFEEKVWSLHVLITSVGSEVPRSEGVRVHLYGKEEDCPDHDKPTKRWWPLGRPTIDLVLYDPTPSAPHR